jgi:DNA-binding response OmpR family regulator
VVISGARNDGGWVSGPGDVTLNKPFDPRELLLVVRGFLQERSRADASGDKTLSLGPITLDLLFDTATVESRELKLTRVETRILRELMLRAGSPATRERLMNEGLGRDWSPVDRCLDTHINRLRRKIGRDVRGRTPIRTIRGVGYLLLAGWEPSGSIRSVLPTQELHDP